ncbi:MAG TPA: hypothetical protein VF253_09830 [Candidatus Limnocylindrales bacterium]|jgi:hypothetical protein
MNDLGPWLRAHWQLIAAPALTVAIIGFAMLWLRPAAPEVTGPFLVDNPAGVVEGAEYRPDIDPEEFTTEIDNPYMPLVVGRTLTYQEGNERVVITVADSTRTVMGVDVRVVRDREYDGERLIEDTEDWFAQDNDGNVWYFGEATAECRDGVITTRAGEWQAGVDGAQPGIVMLAAPRVGDYYRQEYYRGRAEDVARVRELGATVEHEETRYEDVLVTEDFTALEPGQLEHKMYAPDVGLIEEGPAGGVGVRLVDRTDGDPVVSDPTTLCQP